MDKNTAGAEENRPHADLVSEVGTATPSAREHPSYMTDEEVERAAEKVFRIHARLFEELAK